MIVLGGGGERMEDRRSEDDEALFRETEEEWENLAEITAEFRDSNEENSGRVQRVQGLSSSLVTFEQVVDYLNSGVLDSYLAQVSDHPPGSMEFILSCFCVHTILPHKLASTKETILATALIPFQNDETIHLAVLRTLYRQLTGGKLDCPRYGQHWEDIGFQGSDPATDLRGVGFLGLVQVLYLLITPELLPFARDVYALSRKEDQEFPLMVLSLNVTRISLHILRDGLLNKQILKDNDVWLSFNFLFCSVLHHIYHIWKTQHKTISNSGFVLKDAEQYARGHLGRVLEDFATFLNTNYSIQEKQAAREQIRQATAGPSGVIGS